MNHNIKPLLYALMLSAVGLFVFGSCDQEADNKQWVSIFNGADLDGWTVKISGSPPGVDTFNTFIVEDSILKVSYEQYDAFNNRYGHLFYNTPLSRYRLKLQYRFTGEKLPDSPWWTENNSGVMIHSQAPESMPLIPDPMDENVDFLNHFPTSVECQLLADAVTANACQIHTIIDVNGEKAGERNISSNSAQYAPGEWVRLEIVVLADSVVHHIIEGDTVLTYSNLRLEDNSPLAAGFIALQAESQPVEFKHIKIMQLSE